MSDNLTCKQEMRKKYRLGNVDVDGAFACDAPVNQRNIKAVQCMNCGSIDGHHWGVGCAKAPQIDVNIAGNFCANGHLQLTDRS